MADDVMMTRVAELRFPKSGLFSPLATSSPKLTKMRCPNVSSPNRSWTSSDESSGNITSQLVAGINETHLDNSKAHNDSSASIRTALEYVDPRVISDRPALRVITRAELHKAIYDIKIADDVGEEDADFYAVVVTERILWSACRTWVGTLLIQSDDLDAYAKYARDDWYMMKTVSLCADELRRINEQGKFNWNCVATYCCDKGIPVVVARRIFSKNLVRRTTGDSLNVAEMAWLLFATVGTDEAQSLEYWFRVLDVHSTGTLKETELKMFYEGISNFLAEHDVVALPFHNVMEQFSDILGTAKWSLGALRKQPKLAGKVINGFVNAYRFLEQEIDEKTNGERVDDENFGEGPRTRWQRMIDHEFDEFYREPSPSTTFTK